MKAVEIIVPSDKSISHRVVMLASISKGVTRIKNLLMAEDIKRTIEVFRAMGVKIGTDTIFKHGKNGVCPYFIVKGVGMRGLKKPSGPLYLGNSGTTMRILPGILAGQDFEVVLTGDKSLSARPMRRIVEPLERMGACIKGQGTRDKGQDGIEIYPPLKIHGGKLKAIQYKSTIASAQVKSCILLAGLYADGVTSVSEPEKSRDHTERILKMFGCRLKVQGSRVSLKGPVELNSPGTIGIPGDISSAAFFITAGCILPNAKIVIKNVGLNPTRIGVLEILKRMRADIKLTNMSLRGVAERRRSNLKERDCFGRHRNNGGLAMTKSSYESAGDIIVKSSELRGITISPAEVVRAIDEIPIIMVAACFAKGKTVIKGIEELRVKETDRIKSMVTNLRRIGADIRLKAQGSRLKGKIQPRASSLEPKREHIVINGGRPLHSAKVSSFGDHRTAMSMLVAGLGIKGKVTVTGLDCINKSFPGFERLLRRFAPRNDTFSANSIN